ncbi:MAG: glycine cleavage system protein T [Gammaproteobacteria bacterium]|nr:glycine cleavage system protein T [Gammaproteobacteria bacterium]MDH5303889.1 glycine cleavage system protein T [Gammaproteobacteria bacterium]MDH5322379.1 glycine cleavage system protein T [Gammaproteobacteria bacterium]
MSSTAKLLQISIGPRVRKSPFFAATLRYGAEAFTVYNHTYMPTSYGDNVRDYWSLVNDVTLWDVSCQRQVEIAGPDAYRLVEFLSARDMSGCGVGQCQYILLTDEAGGIVNDAVLLRIEQNRYWISPGDGDVLWWVKGVAVSRGLDVSVVEPDVSPLQLQGPKAPHVAYALFGDWALDLKYYHLRETSLHDIPLVVSRTGWSGEHCYEIYLRDSQFGDRLWERIMQAGRKYNIAPTSPSTIRSIEGGLLSYRSDITTDDNPWTVGMGRFVHLDRDADFIGREALQKIRTEGTPRRLVGVEIDGDALDFNDALWAVQHKGVKVGHVSRCCFSPRLKKNIGWANLPVELTEIGTQFALLTPAGERGLKVCEAPWFKSFVAIPEALKAEIRSGNKAAN